MSRADDGSVGDVVSKQNDQSFQNVGKNQSEAIYPHRKHGFDTHQITKVCWKLITNENREMFIGAQPVV